MVDSKDQMTIKNVLLERISFMITELYFFIIEEYRFKFKFKKMRHTLILSLSIMSTYQHIRRPALLP